MRSNQRNNNQLRDIKITRHYTKYAEGSVLIEYGNTKVICTASIIIGVPRFLRDKKQGWLTAEYGMLPRSTNERMNREATHGKQSGRTLEIQRLIGRSLRAAVNLKKLGENTIHIDCDVLQADGGTRTASITGGCIALADAIRYGYEQGLFADHALQHLVASVSVGIVNGEPVLDLDYAEDSTANTDMNVVMTDENKFIEIQGTAETNAFSADEYQSMITIAQKGIKEIMEKQKISLDI